MKKVLIVDDEPGITQLLKATLEGTGKYQVRTENRGMMGLSAARQFRPDAAILDIMMPDLEGTEVLSKIRELPGMKNLPVIILTATLMKGETILSDPMKSSYFMAKPLEMDELLGALESILGGE
jgi:two-component system OmpR family response regulator